MTELRDNALTTLETVKKMLGVSSGDNQYDELIVCLINAASAWIETQLNRRLGMATYIQRLPGSGSQELVLRQWPIVSVEYVRDARGGSVIPAGSYSFQDTGDIGVLYKDDGWLFRGYIGGLAGDYIASTAYLEVKYTAGYVLPKDADGEHPATLPSDLEAVVWGVVEQEFSIRQNGAQGLSAFSISDVSWTFDKEPRPSWMETINRYVRW